MSGAHTRHSTPLVIVLRHQLALFWAGRRRGFLIGLGVVLVQVVLLAGPGVIIGVRIQRDDDPATRTVDFGTRLDEFEEKMREAGAEDDDPSITLGFNIDGAPQDSAGSREQAAQESGDGVLLVVKPAAAALAFCFLALFAVGLSWPARVWRGEPPAGRDYHWSLPVERRTHDLLRVAAGAVWLFALTLLLGTLTALTALIYGNAVPLAGLSAPVWIELMLAPQLIYLLASALWARFDHPAAVLWGSSGALAVATGLAAQYQVPLLGTLLPGIFLGPWGLLNALAGPAYSELVRGTPANWNWALTCALWLVVAGTALFWATTPGRRRAA